jgi:sarcosine oxidase, subunit beta
MIPTYDAIIIGAGSIGVPISIGIAEAGLKTLVIEELASPGQGQNKAAIGGVRATHSHFSKIKTCQRSIDIFSTWQERFGDDIGWKRGGYCFVAYNDELASSLKELVIAQRRLGLDIDWLEKDALRAVAPDLQEENLRGGTFSPGDGSASPLASMAAFWKRARSLGAHFCFKESVVEILREGSRIVGVRTSKESYSSPAVILAAGANAREIGSTIGLNLSVKPDSHEAGITEPCRSFTRAMIVDMRKESGSENYYFYQNSEGQIVFCITPYPPLVGKNRNETSWFLPTVSRRMLSVMPRLSNLRVRRTWRGLYPMTPDGFPIVGKAPGFEGLYLAAGMCGQGFMLGPGIGELVSRLVLGRTSEEDREVLKGYDPEREFSGCEVFK